MNNIKKYAPVPQVQKNVTYFSEPDTTKQNVLLFFHGQFPKNCIMHKDATLPMRLFPNAQFTIRCARHIDTINYFKEQYRGKQIKFVYDDDQTLYTKLDEFDSIYAHYILICAMRAKLGNPLMDFQRMLYLSKTPVYIFFNDENIEPFKWISDFYKYQKQKNDIDILKENHPYLMKSFKGIDLQRKDFMNVNLLCNENKLSNWGDSCFKEYFEIKKFNICYLSDIILYDLPNKSILEKQVHESYDRDGVFIAFFLKERIDCMTSLFNLDLINLSCFGKHSEKLPTHLQRSMSGKLIENEQIPSILRKYSWSIYIGKACLSKYLGATFYEPLLVGVPIFIWNGTDPEHKIFPDIDCYFKDEHELVSLINKTDLKELYINQINSIYENRS